MRFHFARAALFALSAVAGVSSAFASASSSADISNLTFSLIDLDPTDGVAPSFQFLSTGTYAGSYATQVSGSVQNNAGPYSSANFTVGDVTTFADLKHTEVIPGVTISAAAGQYFLNVSGSAQSASTSYNGAATTQSGSSYYYPPSLVGLQLSANTALIITADAATQAAATNSCTNTGYYGNCEQASATVSMQLTGPALSGGTGGQSSSASLSSSVTGSGGYYTYVYDPVHGYYTNVYHAPDGSPLSQAAAKKLSVSFVNNSSANEVASFSASVSVTGSAVTAVPEPSTFALVGLGLGFAGFLARRRVG